MGLTNLPLKTFYWISQLGMLAGTMAYINAGLQLSKLNSIKGILSFELLVSFGILGILPLLSKKILERIKALKVYRPFRHMKPRKFDYDMVVIGGGAAGLVTSYISSAVKSKVALIEKNKMGGDCLYTGCIPSKAIIRSAHFIHEARNSKNLGIFKAEIKYDFKEIMARVQKVIKKIEPHDSIERYRKLGVDCFKSHAQITSPWTVKVDGKVLRTRNITLATGAEPIIPDIPGLSQVSYSSSDTLWNLKELPKKLMIIGAGPIGCELSQVFARLGSNVTLMQNRERIMAYEDEVVSSFVTKRFESEGIKILTNSTVESFIQENNKYYANCKNSKANHKIEFDHLLIAIGRKARVKGFGLEKLGLDLRPNGTLDVNDFLQTKYPNIYACGDATGPFQLTHAAAHQAWFCSVNGLFGQFKNFKVNYDALPWCTYTDPEVATVGLNEHKAKKNNVDYEITEYYLDDLDRSITDSTDYGFIRVLTAPGKDKILGATIVGAQASNLITEFVTAIKHGLGLNKILGTIHVYPSLAEANKYVAGNWRKTHSNPKVLKMLQKYFKWKRS